MKVCGIDPSRQSFAVSIVDDFEEFSYKEYENSYKGFTMFIRDLKLLEIKPPICIEGYGDFAKQLSLYLQHHSYKIYEVNPRMLNSLKNSMTVHKSDHIDAYTCAISYFIRKGESLNINGEMEGLKNLSRLYRKISSNITSIKNQFHSSLNQGFGSIYKEIFSNINNMSLIFYSHYGSIKEIQDSTEEEIFEVLGKSNSYRYKGKHGRMLSKRIKDVVETIDTDIIETFADIQSTVIKGYAETLITLLQQKEKIHKQIESYVNKMFPNYKEYFTEIKGLTPLFFGLLVSEGIITRTFKDEGHFASYCGQAPRQVQSANLNKFKSHKNYNRNLAATIHFIACQNVLKHGIYYEDYINAKQYYNRKLRALKKIKRKLTRTLYYKFMLYKIYLINNDIVNLKQEYSYVN